MAKTIETKCSYASLAGTRIQAFNSITTLKRILCGSYASLAGTRIQAYRIGCYALCRYCSYASLAGTRIQAYLHQ